MTADQKTNVAALRQQGYGYQRIANELGITVSTVKGFCQRNRITSQPVQYDEVITTKTETEKLVCKCCGVPITHTAHARKKVFCSTACRLKWWNEHLDQVERKAVYSFTCAACGKEFTAYGDKERKYCCHECYIKDRFGRRTA